MKTEVVFAIPRLTKWVAEVSYREWKFVVRQDRDNIGGDPYLQLETHLWKSRKWKLSPWMVKSEVINTCFKAVMTAEEHEIREAFNYRGVPIYGPHYNVDALVAARRSSNVDELRNDSMDGGAEGPA